MAGKNRKTEKILPEAGGGETNIPPESVLRNVVPIRPAPPFATGEGEGFSGPKKQIERLAASFALPDDTDMEYRASLAKMTGGLSPASLILACMDWGLHLSSQPLKQQKLFMDALEKMASLGEYACYQMGGRECGKCIESEEGDDRFDGEGWQSFPFNVYAQSFLLAQDWWQQAATGIEGISQHHEDVVRFSIRQWLDMLAPSNFPLTSPKILNKTLESGGMNFLEGAGNFLEDVRRFTAKKLPRGTEKFRVGRELATAEGKVVYRNELLELIQYAPQTATVHPEPVLMVPAWIMKYYILDLSPDNSMVKYLTGEGHTVFMISWKNPDKQDAGLGMNDYLRSGVMEALDAVSAIVPDRKIHAVGYCIGGTLLSIAAAWMTRKSDDRLKTMTLFTTQVDFEEAGELMLFIDESELALLEDLMRKQGYLKKEQVSGAFNMLRSKDLIWSHIVEQYLQGEDEDMFDLMAWNVDATRLPYRMHSEYLRSMYLNNDLAENRYTVEGEIISLGDVEIPVFAVATQKDHIAPWKSVYEIHELIGDAELSFLLTSGGHNAGVISEPGHKGRKYQLSTREAGGAYIPPEKWRKTVRPKDGSWWPAWQKWLKNHSGRKVKPPSMGAPGKGYKVLGDAPGTYVHML